MPALFGMLFAETEVLGTKQLKKITKLKDKEVFAAIGWLAREAR